MRSWPPLRGGKIPVYRGVDRDKPFVRMTDKHVMYVERVGVLPLHKSGVALRERARRRAGIVQAEHGMNELVIEPKKRRRRT